MKIRLHKLTKQEQLDYVYTVLSSFYGLTLTPGWRVKALSCEAVTSVYVAAKLNAQFGDSLPEQVRNIESWINVKLEGF